MLPQREARAVDPERVRPSLFPPRLLCGLTTVRSYAADLGAPCSCRDEVAGDAAIPAHVGRHAFAAALARDLGVRVGNLKFQQQVHGAGVRWVNAASPEAESDALICAEPEVVLCVRLADCGGVVLFDPHHDAVAAVHSGWRGTRADIVAATVAAMAAQFGTRPRDLLAWIAPCASVASYEVGDEFAAWFPRHVERRGARLHFDNQAALREQLSACGVPVAAIEVSPLCTIADRRFHSHRRDGAAAGRNCLWAMLQPRRRA